MKKELTMKWIFLRYSNMFAAHPLSVARSSFTPSWQKKRKSKASLPVKRGLLLTYLV
ncbi:BH3012 [Halalkalibacterium halodurans C-125]|uniref:BH3012 protein n=1 Tax=Halalkalibacterium halodurans (strain ATCC BAA-125 / DSM 18197 / FERM 7344 / JCM 9153 / C-125) TaxID=272558 RepID=Q9K8J4_HALH5|nr:BH3012 [Halalkalibacterium halodurans C-125]